MRAMTRTSPRIPSRRVAITMSRRDPVPVPSAAPDALADATELRIDRLDIPIEHTGPNEIELGEVLLPNGLLTTADFALVDDWPAGITILEGRVDLEIRSTVDGKPIWNIYEHGWREGTERVEAVLVFDVFRVRPGRDAVDPGRRRPVASAHAERRPLLDRARPQPRPRAPDRDRGHRARGRRGPPLLPDRRLEPPRRPDRRRAAGPGRGPHRSRRDDAADDASRTGRSSRTRCELGEAVETPHPRPDRGRARRDRAVGRGTRADRRARRSGSSAATARAARAPATRPASCRTGRFERWPVRRASTRSTRAGSGCSSTSMAPRPTRRTPGSAAGSRSATRSCG